jgi:glutathione-specific gamma-glutamylcyclotransferase
VQTPQGSIAALVFTANHSHPEHVGELPPGETAAIIASGAGVLGTNREYLEQLAQQLATLGIEDAYIEQMVRQVRDVGGV